MGAGRSTLLTCTFGALLLWTAIDDTIVGYDTAVIISVVTLTKAVIAAVV